MDTKIKFSVIIPTFEEEQNIRYCIQSIRKSNYSDEVEIIISDGGSRDKTVAIAEAENVYICKSDPGRGIQCNKGAENSTSEILLFLHVDSILAVNAFEIVNEMFINRKIKVGTFRMNFDQNKVALKIYSFFTRFDSVFTSFGDQCIVVRKDIFTKLGGFPNWKLFEDVHFLRLARRETKVHSLSSYVTTSARRFMKDGLIRQQLKNLWHIIQYYFGVSHKSLYKQYYGDINHRQNAALIIFARYPQPGKVKTRLGKTIGMEQATSFYKICAEHTFSESKKVSNLKKYIFCSKPNEIDLVSKWIDGDFCCFAQTRGDLGRRMSDAFSIVFKRGANKVLIIGTDVPDISQKHITITLDALEGHDIVVGPAYDGGYYLLGMKENYSQLFEDIPWSTDQVFEKTIDVATHLGLKIYILPKLYDIDTEKDLHEWSRNKGNSKSNPVFSWLSNSFK